MRLSKYFFCSSGNCALFWHHIIFLSQMRKHRNQACSSFNILENVYVCCEIRSGVPGHGGYRYWQIDPHSSCGQRGLLMEGVTLWLTGRQRPNLEPYWIYTADQLDWHKSRAPCIYCHSLHFSRSLTHSLKCRWLGSNMYSLITLTHFWVVFTWKLEANVGQGWCHGF